MADAIEALKYIVELMQPRCTYVGCKNTARYVDDGGNLCCALCPLKEGRDSIRLTNVPELLATCRDFAAGISTNGEHGADLARIIGRRP